jgi:hypothetical protein
MASVKRKSFIRRLFQRRKGPQTSTCTEETVSTSTKVDTNKSSDHSYSETDGTYTRDQLLSTPDQQYSCSTDNIPSCSTSKATDNAWQRAYEIARQKLSEDKRNLLSDERDGSSGYRAVLDLTRSNRQRTHRKKFHKIVKGVETYANIVDVAIQHSPTITALVWAGVRFLLQVSVLVIQEVTRTIWRRC